jgi:hypothetical protein
MKELLLQHLQRRGYDVGADDTDGFRFHLSVTCGDPIHAASTSRTGGDARVISADDALAVLRAAVGTFTCDLCVCDVDNSGAIVALDAAKVLLSAVGVPSGLHCPPCEYVVR